ncbi:hypothetical protein RQP46_006142 [Phenoliferia psychrophenolica]
MADAQPSATLTSLSHELLAAIAWLVAPEGGRKAANLRLACRAVYSATAPCVWTALIFPSVLTELDLCLSYLIKDADGRVERITSVCIDATTPFISTIAALLPTFPRLKRVTILGAGGQDGQADLPWDLMSAIDRSPSIVTLAFDRISPAQLFSNTGTFGTRIPAITTLRYREPAGGAGSQVTNTVKLAYAVASAARLIELQLDEICPPEHPSHFYMQTHSVDWAGHTGPLEVALFGLFGLFHTSEVHQHDATTTLAVNVLNWIGCPSTLSLPVYNFFNINAHFRNLHLPKLQHLALLTYSRQPAGVPDLLSTKTYRNLARLLSITPLPSLTTLRLRGWLDHTSVKRVALVSDGDLPIDHLEIYGLLGCLRSTGVVKLTLQNSEGHPDELVECVFERDDKDATEWRKRRVTFF